MPVLAADDIQRHSYPLNISTAGNLDRYKQSPMYHQLIEYMQGGEAKMDELGVSRNRRRALRHRAKSFLLPSHADTQYLLYVEPTGSHSICIIEEEIHRFLSAAHEDHGYYSAALILDFLIGRAYWPNRVKDVRRFLVKRPPIVKRDCGPRRQHGGGSGGTCQASGNFSA